MTATSDLRAVDVLVVTALALERTAVLAHLSESAIHGVDHVTSDVGVFHTPSGPLKVAVIETGAGNINASVLTSVVETALRPRLVMMIGVAGGVKDVQIGDVVAASKVYWIEGGKTSESFRPRPEVVPVSQTLVQIARRIAGDQTWITSAPPSEGSSSAFVGPIAAGEKIVASGQSATAKLIGAAYGDTLAVAMEDFGVLHAASSPERAKFIAIRGISDLLDGKALADASGSQVQAASNAAAFAFELLALFKQLEPKAPLEASELAKLGASLYPDGPNQNSLWERAGGDPSRLNSSGPGFSRWWQAAVLLDLGGGGRAITQSRLLEVMRADFPNHEEIRQLPDREL